MSFIRLDGDPPVEIKVRHSSRASRLSLRVSSLDGQVTMTLPRDVPIAEAESFAEERQDWIRTARSKAIRAQKLSEGSTLPLEGRIYQIVLESRRAAILDGDMFRVPARAPGRAAVSFLKLLARDRLAEACDHYAGAVGKPYTALTLRDTRSRWGSCSEAGRLMFSWRLILAPPAVLRYVAAHEVAHLVRMDHSPAFWDVVEKLDPTWREHRGWLREYGAGLHAYQFVD